MRNTSISAIILGLFAVIGTTLVSFTYDSTREQIKANQRMALLRSLHHIIKPDEHDNDIFTDVIMVTNPTLLGSAKPVPVYRARKQGKPVAAVIASVAPDGYNGSIYLLVGIYHDGSLAGVRVVRHIETPGLGDLVDEQKSDWILRFRGKSLQDPQPDRWKVKRDGGEFDQFTGATITPRAVVKAVYNSLLYFRQNREQLFRPIPDVRPMPNIKQDIKQDARPDTKPDQKPANVQQETTQP